MIKSIKSLKNQKITVNLLGPDGNAYVLLGIAQDLSKQLGKDPKPILEAMRGSDYENLLKVFDKEFGMFVDLYR